MRRILNCLLASTGWFAVIAQLVLMIGNRVTPVGETIVRFFSFFTILTNTLVSVYFLLRLLNTGERSSSLINRPHTLTAITVYITLVGLVYQVALRHVWQPTGLQMVVDELLHTVIPVCVIIYWSLYEDKSGMRWKVIPAFLIYPVAYLVYILTRGAFSGFYPYPFMDVAVLGWKPVLLNIFLLLITILVLSSLFVGAGKLISGRKS